MTARELQWGEQHESLVLPNARILFYPGLYAQSEAQRLFDTLRAELAWRQEVIRLFGKRHAVPRLSALYGDRGLVYRYSGIAHQAQVWTPTLSAVRADIERLAETRFNSVLANLYRHGNDSNGWHADNEPELGREPVIASLSLGAARDFQFKHRTLPQHNYRCELGSGSLLIMAGNMQAQWLHQLPKRRRISDARINLTFRLIRQSQ